MFSFSLPPLFPSSEAEPQEMHLEPVFREQMAPHEFLQLLQSDTSRIKSSTFVPPRLGDNHFGYFEVEYDRPVYK